MRFAGRLDAVAYSWKPVVWADLARFESNCGLLAGCRNSILLT